jgi:hypothetical protein
MNSLRAEDVEYVKNAIQEKYIPEPMSGCFLWLGGIDKKTGYGRIVVTPEFKKSIDTTAHRLSYIAFKGPIPEGHDIDHLCRNKACVNPNHLEPVSPKENLQRGWDWRKKNSPLKTCRQGHLREGDNFFYSEAPNRKPIFICRVCRRVYDKNKYYNRKEREKNNEQ